MTLPVSKSPDKGAPAELILASGSRYRAQLLERLRLPFRSAAPEVDETPLPSEPPQTLAERLARAKAAALRADFPLAALIGSDQVAVLGNRVLGKPGTRERAIEQLTAASGQAVRFITALALDLPDGVQLATDITTVQFRKLGPTDITRYVDAEPALDCAGSFKCEGYGITLFERIESEDPTALIGLPLIALSRLLRDAGFQLP